MKNLLIILAGLLILGIFSNCKKADTNFNPGQQKVEYNGNATMVMQYYDYNPYTGQDYFIEEKQYNYNVSVFINPPMKSGGTIESNPFNLQISPDRGGMNDEEGHVDIISSQTFAVSTGYVLLQYWNYTLTGNQITGILQDNHTAEAAAGNLIWAWDDIAGIVMIMPYAIANGAVMTGTVTANNVSLSISGQSTDTYRKFSCQINAVPQ